MLLFQIAVIPLQQFYLTQAARSGALIYIQIKHYDGNNGKIENILKEMTQGKFDTLESDAEEITESFIRNEFINSANGKSLPGKLFNVSKIKITIGNTNDTQRTSSEVEKSIGKIGKLIAHVFCTEKVKITVTYPFTLLKFLNLSFGTFCIEGSYSVRYNP